VTAETNGGGGQLIALAIPTITKPYWQNSDAVEAAVPLIEAAGYRLQSVYTFGNPYISAARATMLRKALDARADAVVFIDHDVSFEPEDLLSLIRAKGEVVAGTYRFKKDDEEYMGEVFRDADGDVIGRDDGSILMTRVPAGFLKITREGVARFARRHPHLLYGDVLGPSVDLFNHGAHEGVWWGEDYAFSRNWLATGEPLWLLPNLNLTHHGSDRDFPGNFHRYLRRLPGGDLAEAT